MLSSVLFYVEWPQEPQPTLVSELIWFLVPDLVAWHRGGGKYLFSFTGTQGQESSLPAGFVPLFRRPRFIPFYRHPVLDAYIRDRFMGLPDGFLSFVEHATHQAQKVPRSIEDLARWGVLDRMGSAALLEMKPAGVLSSLTAKERQDLVDAEIRGRLLGHIGQGPVYQDIANLIAKVSTENRAPFISYLHLLIGLLEGQMEDMITPARLALINPTYDLSAPLLRLLALLGITVGPQATSSAGQAGQLDLSLDLGLPGFAKEEEIFDKTSNKKRKTAYSQDKRSRKTVK